MTTRHSLIPNSFWRSDADFTKLDHDMKQKTIDSIDTYHFKGLNSEELGFCHNNIEKAQKLRYLLCVCKRNILYLKEILSGLGSQFSYTDELAESILAKINNGIEVFKKLKQAMTSLQIDTVAASNPRKNNTRSAEVF